MELLGGLSEVLLPLEPLDRPLLHAYALRLELDARRGLGLLVFRRADGHVVGHLFMDSIDALVALGHYLNQGRLRADLLRILVVLIVCAAIGRRRLLVDRDAAVIFIYDVTLLDVIGKGRGDRQLGLRLSDAPAVARIKLLLVSAWLEEEGCAGLGLTRVVQHQVTAASAGILLEVGVPLPTKRLAGQPKEVVVRVGACRADFDQAQLLEQPERLLVDIRAAMLAARLGIGRRVPPVLVMHIHDASVDIRARKNSRRRSIVAAYHHPGRRRRRGYLILWLLLLHLNDNVLLLLPLLLQIISAEQDFAL